MRNQKFSEINESDDENDDGSDELGGENEEDIQAMIKRAREKMQVNIDEAEITKMTQNLKK